MPTPCRLSSCLPSLMVTYLFVLAYIAAGATYWIAVAAGLG